MGFIPMRCSLVYLECAVKFSASSDTHALTALVAASSLGRITHRKCPVAFAVSAGCGPNEAAHVLCSYLLAC